METYVRDGWKMAGWQLIPADGLRLGDMCDGKET